jgi:hypothetical protein
MFGSSIFKEPISLSDYRMLCNTTDISPNYHPDFLEYYSDRLGFRPKIIGCFHKKTGLFAAYPTLFSSVFPNPLHSRIMPKQMRALGDIGQPEILFPMSNFSPKVNLNCLSPVTSPLLHGSVRKYRDLSFRNIAIAKPPSSQRIRNAEKSLAVENGTLLSTWEMDPRDFASIYLTLHAERWGRSLESYADVAHQIISLYKHVYGGVLLFGGEPVAALFAFCVSCKNIQYIDAVSYGVKLKKTRRTSAGSILLINFITRAETLAKAKGKKLRFSLGYIYGNASYKNQWGNAEATFVAF